VRPGAPSHEWRIDFVLLAAIWGASFMFMRAGAMEFGALPTAGMRVLIAALCLLPLLVFQGHGQSLRQNWKLSFLVGIMSSAIPFVCFTYALLSISTGLSSILNATTPLFGALIAWLWMKDRPNGSRILGLVIGFAGVAMLAWSKTTQSAASAGGSSGWAILACLLACLCYAVAANFTKRHLSGVPSLVLATGSQMGAAIGLLPLTWYWWPDHQVSRSAWLALLAVGVVCTAVAYVLYFRLIARAGPARALSVTFAIPVFAMFYGVVLLGEEVTIWMLVSALVIGAGTALSSGLMTLGRRN
jgi:drug/metabolite transporter (DMT)-like permease